MYQLGVDLGGTKILAAGVDNGGKILQRRQEPTNVAGGPEAVLAQIANMLSELAAGQKPRAVGIGLAGQIDGESGTVFFAPNLHWKNVPVKKVLEERLKLPVIVTNDVRAATFGEWQHGAGQGCQELVCIFVGTGLGGGIVSRGSLLKGATNSAGEIGHMVLQRGGNVCSCGRKGCFEAYASGWAIKARAGGLTAQEVQDRYRKGDPEAKKIFEELVEALIGGTRSVINCLNPQKVIFGGGVMEGWKELFEPVKQGIVKDVLESASLELEIVRAALGRDAGVIGAAHFHASK